MGLRSKHSYKSEICKGDDSAYGSPICKQSYDLYRVLAYKTEILYEQNLARTPKGGSGLGTKSPYLYTPLGVRA